MLLANLGFDQDREYGGKADPFSNQALRSKAVVTHN